MDDKIRRVGVVVVRCHLDVPIHFGSWTMNHRDFALVRVESEQGLSGFAYCLTRDGPVEEVIRRTIAPVYVGQSVTEPEGSFYSALWSNHAVHASGIGMRALSTVDIAAWDLAAKSAGVAIAEMLGGSPIASPVTAIVGYPPSISAEETAEQITELAAHGWKRFKLPIAPTVDQSIARLEAARCAAPDAWIGIDANMVFRSATAAIDFSDRIKHLGIGWLEDVVPPGDAGIVAQIRRGSEVPIAMGDEQGGSYFPEALVSADAVDVLRVDATTDGGVTRLREILMEAKDNNLQVAPHMFPHVHSQLMGGLGFEDAPIEWGVPGTGVHPMDDVLIQPTVRDGRMEPLQGGLGFGRLVDVEWVRTQVALDVDEVLSDGVDE